MYDTTLGRFIQRDPNGLTGENVNLYEYVNSRPTALVDPAGKDGWSRKLDWGPRLLDGKLPSYDIGIIHMLPPVPKGATQVWQVVTCGHVVIDKKCKTTTETTHTIDIVKIGERKEIKDQLSWILRVDVCLAAEVCSHIAGFDDQKSDYAQQTNVRVTERLANELLGKMAGPKEEFWRYYLYVKNSNCKECCGVARFLIGLIPDGEYLTIGGVGTWSSGKR